MTVTCQFANDAQSPCASVHDSIRFTNGCQQIVLVWGHFGMAISDVLPSFVRETDGYAAN